MTGLSLTNSKIPLLVIVTILILFLSLPVSGIVASDIGDAPFQATGTLHVDGDPPGMEIILDGRVAGQVPESGVLVIEDVAVGEHRIIGTASGFSEKEAYVLVPDGLPVQVRMTLDQMNTGILDVTSVPDNVQVYVNNVYRGITPLHLTDIKQGPNEVTLRLSGYQDWSALVEVAGEPVSVTGELISLGSGSTTPAGGPSGIVTILLIGIGCIGALFFRRRI